ncbi:isochorismatase family protein [Tsukamurella sp. 8F]|uniref:isochorismatase family protein n=1 Tax=unclassified Tsukamurella TaxID=2633480 RepID=UPI0023B9C38E|nr:MULTISPECIES: isochorismatase family protein [unclassified Tsukamurella]MDF0531481.1 isochorismatase family protein [Tsukamurella sp. 8J]MDF0588725.1 isochorismatase family protein [Tsukamurella sp. 8F]
MRTALLVIDVQQSFRERPTWAQVSNPDIADDVNALVAQARGRGDDVIWILHSEPGSDGVFDPDSGFVALVPELTPTVGEPVLVKTSRNAFTTTRLGQILQQRGVGRVVISGIQTEQCCETTARVAADLGYDVVFVTEATATFPITRPDTGAVLPAAAVVERTEFALAGRFARIAGLADALGEQVAS